MYFIFVLILILVLLYLNPQLNISIRSIENFYLFSYPFSSSYQTHQSYFPINTYKYPLVNPADSPYKPGYWIPYSNGYTDLPWWNTQLGNTTNMSYDYRGDPLIIPRTNFVWNNGTNFPIYNSPV